jgi:hypothetical protein
MARKPYYTSQELIDAVKRKIAMPITQNTFSEEDILNFANEELFLSQVPSILQYHEEYLVYNQEIDLEDSVSRYDIPPRAIGMKLRDLFYVDENGNVTEMSNVGLSNADYFDGYNGSFQVPRKFYIESNEIVIVPRVTSAPQGHLLAKYYLRPNSLVLNERAAICTHFLKEVTIGTVVTGNTLTVGDNELVAGTDFAIGVTAAATATNINNAINALDLEDISSTVSSSVVSISYQELDTEISSDSANITVSTRVGICCDEIPDHFEDGIYVDFLQTEGGHKTYDFDVKIPREGVSSNAVFFESDVIPTGFVVGDYICEQNECIIPQIPSDLHNLLAERTCVRILEALGDTEGVKTQNTKIIDLEQRQAVLIDNRVEGAPRKIFNRHSLLRLGKKKKF